MSRFAVGRNSIVLPSLSSVRYIYFYFRPARRAATTLISKALTGSLTSRIDCGIIITAMIQNLPFVKTLPISFSIAGPHTLALRSVVKSRSN